MRKINLLEKPELLFRPAFLLRRLLRFRNPRPRETIRLPWGLPICISPSESIGRSIWTFGLFDLIVCETLWRLMDTGGQAVDAGANIGQMTGLLALRCGPAGSVVSFEPHPDVRRELQDNVDSWNGLPQMARIQIHPFALFDRDGHGELSLPDQFESNRGLASVTEEVKTGTRRIPIEMKRLDTIWENSRAIDVMKVDVEGGEPRLLAGAESLLRSGRVRDIVFEDHGPYPSPAMEILEARGYKIHALGLGTNGLRISGSKEKSQHLRPWDSPSFLATLDPERAVNLLRPAGWKCLLGK